jgi:hypothetical protein
MGPGRCRVRFKRRSVQRPHPHPAAGGGDAMAIAAPVRMGDEGCGRSHLYHTTFVCHCARTAKCADASQRTDTCNANYARRQPPAPPPESGTNRNHLQAPNQPLTDARKLTRARSRVVGTTETNSPLSSSTSTSHTPEAFRAALEQIKCIFPFVTPCTLRRNATIALEHTDR